MKIYLDMCAIQRPLDTQNQIRITMETQAVLGILDLCQSGAIELISSDALMFEVEQNINPVRKQYTSEVLSLAKTFIEVSERLQNLANTLTTLNIKGLDALHLVSAEEAEADYFCTCDDRLLKKAKSLNYLKTKVVTPIELIQELQL
jgi:predicted nucleic acid-binding protein